MAWPTLRAMEIFSSVRKKPHRSHTIRLQENGLEQTRFREQVCWSDAYSQRFIRLFEEGRVIGRLPANLR